MKSLRHIIIVFLALPWALGAQFQAVLEGTEVLYKLELILADGSTTLGEITVAEPSVVNGRFYRKVFFRYGLGGDTVVGYVREDTSTGELWFLKGQEDEVKMHDLNLEPGDSIPVPGSWCQGPDSFAHVLSAGMEDGRWTITFDRTFGGDAFCEPLRYIEGVGPNASFFYPFLPDAILPGQAYRICRMRQDGALVYPAGALTDFCGLATPTDEEPRFAADFKAYPNPCSGILHVALAAPTSQLRLYDSRGSLMLSRLLSATEPESTAELDLSLLPAGIYWLSAHDSQGQAYSRGKAIVKE